MSQLSTARVTSASFSGAESMDAFLELYGRALMRLEIDPSLDHSFDLDFTIRAVPGFSIASGHLSPTVNRRPLSMIDNDDIVLVWTSRGDGSLAQSGREVSISDGGAAFASNAEAGVFRGHSLSRLWNFRFTRAMFSDIQVDVDAAMIRPIPADNAVLGLLTRYARVMSDMEALASPELCASVVTHMHDLAALLLGTDQDGLHLARRRGARAAQLRALQDDIKRCLTSRDLSPASVARRHRISERTLRDLFKAEATTFTDYVLDQRLALAYRRLADSRFAFQTISALAFDCGFGDISYFNHAFRRRYRRTPSDVRAARSVQLTDPSPALHDEAPASPHHCVCSPQPSALPPSLGTERSMASPALRGRTLADNNGSKLAELRDVVHLAASRRAGR